jgi:hypothetical protein
MDRPPTRLTDALIQRDQRAFVGDRFVLDHFNRVLQLVRTDAIIWSSQIGLMTRTGGITGAHHPRHDLTGRFRIGHGM